jgi:ABC-type lipoprotein release transport system permease subunit
MVSTNEVVMLILGMGVFWFVVLNKHKIKRIFGWKLILPAFYFLMAGWFFTVLEGIVLTHFFNFLEHLSYTASALIMAFWSRKVFFAIKEEAP